MLREDADALTQIDHIQPRELKKSQKLPINYLPHRMGALFFLYLFELSKAASNILFHILETPTSELIRGTSLSVLGSCQLQDLKYGKILESNITTSVKFETS